MGGETERDNVVSQSPLPGYRLGVPSCEDQSLGDGGAAVNNRSLVEWSGHLRWLFWGDPGGSVVKNLPAHAGDRGSIPGPGGSHHMLGSSWAWEPQLLKLMGPEACEPRGRWRGACHERPTLTASREGPTQ